MKQSLALIGLAVVLVAILLLLSFPANPTLDPLLLKLIEAEQHGDAETFAWRQNIDLADANVKITIECIPDQVQACTQAATKARIRVAVISENRLHANMYIANVPALVEMDKSNIRLVRVALRQTVALPGFPWQGNPRLHPNLQDLIIAEQQGQAESFARFNRITLVERVKVYVNILPMPNQLETAAAAVTKAGGRIVFNYANQLSLVVPIKNLPALGEARSIRLIRPEISATPTPTGAGAQ